MRISDWSSDVCSSDLLFFRRLNISYSENVKPEHVTLQRRQDGPGWDMEVNYEVRKELVGNLDVVGKFHADEELTNMGDGGSRRAEPLRGTRLRRPGPAGAGDDPPQCGRPAQRPAGIPGRCGGGHAGRHSAVQALAGRTRQ